MSELVAQSNMKEFDSTKEKHHTILIIKAIDPGCTLEIQVEDVITGEVIRITTTESPLYDKRVMEAKVVSMFSAAWGRFSYKKDPQGEQEN